MLFLSRLHIYRENRFALLRTLVNHLTAVMSGALRIRTASIRLMAHRVILRIQSAVVPGRDLPSLACIGKRIRPLFPMLDRPFRASDRSRGAAVRTVDFTSGTVLRCTWRKERFFFQTASYLARSCINACRQYPFPPPFVADLMDPRRPRAYSAYIASYAADLCMNA